MEGNVMLLRSSLIRTIGLTLIVSVLVVIGIAAYRVYNDSKLSAEREGPMEITDKERRLMNNKLFQFWRFVMLNLKILKAVDHSKRS
jgi:hypothetical protein